MSTLAARLIRRGAVAGLLDRTFAQHLAQRSETMVRGTPLAETLLARTPREARARADGLPVVSPSGQIRTMIGDGENHPPRQSPLPRVAARPARRTTTSPNPAPARAFEASPAAPGVDPAPRVPPVAGPLVSGPPVGLPPVAVPPVAVPPVAVPPVAVPSVAGPPVAVPLSPGPQRIDLTVPAPTPAITPAPHFAAGEPVIRRLVRGHRSAPAGTSTPPAVPVLAPSALPVATRAAPPPAPAPVPGPVPAASSTPPRPVAPVTPVTPVAPGVRSPRPGSAPTGTALPLVTASPAASPAATSVVVVRATDPPGPGAPSTRPVVVNRPAAEPRSAQPFPVTPPALVARPTAPPPTPLASPAPASTAVVRATSAQPPPSPINARQTTNERDPNPEAIDLDRLTDAVQQRIVRRLDLETRRRGVLR